MLHHSVPLALVSTFLPVTVKQRINSRQAASEKNLQHGASSRRLSVRAFNCQEDRPEIEVQEVGSSDHSRIQKQIDLGRCALVSSAAALLLQCGSCEEFIPIASASTYQTAQAGSHSAIHPVGLHSGQCLTTPSHFTTSVKKNRIAGSHMKQISSFAGSGKQKSLATATRRGLQPVKRCSPACYQIKVNSLTEQIACSSIGALPIASISPAIASNSLAAISTLVSRVDLNVLRSSFGTSFNLLSLCSLVVWMQRSGNLPAETPAILSQVAFKLFIPCFLMSKVATTLISNTEESLIALPLMAVAQVIIGAFFGKVACHLFFREPSLHPAMELSGSEPGDSASLSLAFAEQQLQTLRKATKKKALIVAACAFNNSLTLPLVFMSGVLGSPEEANRAAGYLALYMVGWSPAMWTVGYKILTSGDEVPDEDGRQEQPVWQKLTNWITSVMNPPLYGVLIGLMIGGTPLSHLFLGGREGVPLLSSSFDTVGTIAKLRSVTSGILSPVFEAVTLLGTATLAVQTVVLATSLGASLPKEKVKPSMSKTLEDVNDNKVQVLEDHEANLVRSQSALDSKAFWIISLIRLIIMPLTGILCITALQRANLLPPDSIYRLTVLTETAMPTAQNLVLLAQLNAGTRPLAGTLANLLLRQYALSVIPITIWMAIFLTSGG